MKNIAPDIVRQRFLIEGYFTAEVDEAKVKAFLLGLAAQLDLRTYGEPIVFAPATGMGKDDNAGFDAFVPLIDSGISLYVWSKNRFFSTVIYTCKAFDEVKALGYAKDFFQVEGEMATLSF
tara:strand:+ start:102056 stop:102418 length:363 start_codon:yes stop_codon:yes gene_type:complete